MTRRKKPTSSQNRLARLSQVVQIYEATVAGATLNELAARHGVSRQTVNMIVKGQTHAWLYPIFEYLAERDGYVPRKRGTEPTPKEEVLEIYRMHLEDRKTAAEIAAETGRSAGFVNALLRGYYRPELRRHFRRIAKRAGVDPDRSFRHRSNKLADEAVMQIYRDAAAGRRQVEIAAEHGIHQVQVSQIVRGRVYRHLYHHFEAMGKVRELRPRNRRFKPRQVAAIHRQSRAGKPAAKLAAKYGVSCHSIYNILAGRTYAALHPDRKDKQ